MKNTTLKPVNPKVILATVGLSIIALLLFLRSYFILIAIAAILAYLFNPIYSWFIKKRGGKTRFAITFTALVLFATVTIPIAVILTLTVAQALELLDNFKNLASTSSSISDLVNQAVGELNTQLNKLPLGEEVQLDSEQIISWVKEGASTVLSATVDFVSSMAGGVASFFTQLIIFLFVFSSMLKNKSAILNTISSLNPLGDTMSALYFDKMGAMTSAMVKGQFIIAVAQGLSGVISLWIIGMDYLMFWFFILTFLSIIPLGGGIILIPFGIILILTGNIWQGVLILAWHFLITTNIDNILRPRFVPKSARLDPALTILSVFAGLSMFGFPGIVIGPVIMIIIVTTIKTYLAYKQGEGALATKK